MSRLKGEPFCKGCDRYDEENDRMKNRIYCTFGCEEYRKISSMRAYEYNKATSIGNFAEEQFEHGNKVFGSGIERGDTE